jgi:hypothetical protein
MLLVNRKWQHASAVGCRARKRLFFLHFKAFFCSLPQFSVNDQTETQRGRTLGFAVCDPPYKLKLLCLARDEIISEFGENGLLTFKLR